MILQQERRLSRRKAPLRPTYINLESDYPGMMQDISEGGLRFRVIDSLEQAWPVHFWFVANSKRIRGTGELVWTDEARKTGGLRFTHLSEETWDQIRSWLDESNPRPSPTKDSTPGFTSRGPSAPPKQTAYRTVPIRACDISLHRPPPQPPDSVVALPMSPPAAPRREVSKTTSLPSLGTALQAKRLSPSKAICAALLVMILAASAYIYHRGSSEWVIWPGLRNSGPGKARTATLPSDRVEPPVRSTVSSEPAGIGTPEPRSSQAEMTEAPLQNPPIPSGGFVVQVAAVRREVDTRMWIENLRGREFPAFVRYPTVDGFYRVLVGPYRDEASARSARQELKRAGYESFIRH